MAKILTDQNYIDEVQAKFGTSGDLQIYHDGSNSYIKDAGTGDLIIDSGTLKLRNAAGDKTLIEASSSAVKLYYNNLEKLTTVSGGVSIGSNSLYLGQYSAIYLNGVGPSAGKVVVGTGSSSQLQWVDSVSNITASPGLNISSSTSIGAITKNISLDFTELNDVDGEDPGVAAFVVLDTEDENAKIPISDVRNIDAHWKTFQTVITSNFDDRSSSTSIWYMPLNYISEVTSANYYNTFACPANGTVKRIRMMHTAGSTMSTSFTTELSILKNGLLTSFSGELTPTNGSNDGSAISWAPNYAFNMGDRINFRYQKSATSKYWYGVSVSIIIEFDTV